MALKLMTIGGAMQDLFLTFKSPPESAQLSQLGSAESYLIFPEGRKVDVTHLRRSLGGGAINTAVSFKRLGFSVSSFFKIGTDEAANFIEQSLRELQIDVSAISRTCHTGTGTSFILPTQSGNRVCLAYRGANITLTEQELPWDTIQDYPYLYISSLNGPAANLLPIIAQKAKQHNSFIITNPGSTQLSEHIASLVQALPYIDIIIVNKHEAHLLYQSLKLHLTTQQQPPESIILSAGNNNFSINHLFRELIARGPRMVVITNGAEGAYATDGHYIYFHPVLPTTVISTLGAGDAFASAFSAAIIHEHSLLYALQAGMLNSASVLQYANTQNGLLSEKALSAQQSTLDQSIISITTL